VSIPEPHVGSTEPQQLCRLQAELLDQCSERASRQLSPTGLSAVQAAFMGESICDEYEGPVALLKDAHQATYNRGSTKLLMTVLDNGTMIHGGREPMAAVICVGDCRLMLLRRTRPKGARSGRVGRFEVTYSSDAPGEPGSPPASPNRVEKRVQPAFQCLDKTGTFSDREAVQRALDRGGTVTCITVKKGDILVLWSIGLGIPLPEKVAELCTQALGASAPASHANPPIAHARLRSLGCRLLSEACARLDASVVVAEVVEWVHAAAIEEDLFDDVAAPEAQTPPPPQRPPILPPVASQCKTFSSSPSTPSTSAGSFTFAPSMPSTSSGSFTSAGLSSQSGFGVRSPMPAYVRAR